MAVTKGLIVPQAQFRHIDTFWRISGGTKDFPTGTELKLYGLDDPGMNRSMVILKMQKIKMICVICFINKYLKLLPKTVL